MVITTRQDFITNLLTQQAREAIAEINVFIAEIILDELDFEQNDRFTLHLMADLTDVDAEMIRSQMETAGWKNVTIQDDTVRFYF